MRNTINCKSIKKTNKNSTLYVVLLLLIITLSFTSCTFSEGSEVDYSTKKETCESSNTVPATTIIPTSSPVTEQVTESTVSKKTETKNPINTISEFPEYSGSAFAEINGNVPFFTQSDYTTECFESYSDLDVKGRCGVAYACIGIDTIPTEQRGAIGMVKPSGWHTVRYDDVIPDKYLYNRCHLIAFELSGENANEKNLITGTRYMNIEGMLPFENKVHNYVEQTNNHVLYRSSPIFKDDNLVANGVLLEGYSVEDNGAGICFCVFCYNIQPGIIIDYSNGDSWLEDSVSDNNNTVKDNQNSDSTKYILNTNTKKFHYPSCSSVSDMKEKNKEVFEGTREQAIEMGYSPCKRCNP